MSDIVKADWSGGKDSTCAVMKHIEAGHIVKVVCYIPMFTDEIPLISKGHYDHIIRVADRFRSLGADVYIVHGMTYYEYVTRPAKKGKNKGRPIAWPYVGRGRCGFKRDSKLKALSTVDVGPYDYEDIGIAADETNRMNQLQGTKRSILAEKGITEAAAKAFCEENDMYSPQYYNSRRDGCVLCPEAKDAEIEQWLADYPEARSLVEELQEFVKKERPDRDPPRRGYNWFVKEDLRSDNKRSEG